MNGMPIEHLQAHGLSERLVALWKARYTDRLLPLQEKAIKTYGVLQGKNVMLFAPTTPDTWAV